MKKFLRKTLALMLLVATVLSLMIVNVHGATRSKMNRYNVVFVTDASGSMINTDPDEFRFESIDLFVSLLANGGNRVGSVVFSDGVVSTHDLVEVNGRTEKNSITEQVCGQKATGWTDIGAGLLTAVNMLKADGDKSLPSIIILLTDGNTEMGSEEETAISIAQKEDALEEARNNGIQIYSISLNKNNTANSDELKQIAAATGGQFEEVSDAGDLQSVFDLYYQMIYSTQSVKLVDEVVPDTGIISKDFDVADLGVEEVNVVIFGDVSNCRLRKPDGSEVPATAMNDMVYKCKTFTLLKISEPEKGIWNLTVDATPGSTIKIFKIYNSNLTVEADIVNKNDAYILNQSVDFLAKIKEDDVLVTDLSRYVDYKAVLEVKDYEGRVVHNQQVTELGADGFELSFIPTDYGTYYAVVVIETDELYAESETFTLNVGNTPPVAVSDIVKKHIYRWPFLIKTNSTIDLSQTATDAEDSALRYRIKSSTWMEDDYTLDGDQLTIDKFSVSKGSFTIEAYDSMGAYCKYEVKVTSTNVGLWAVILILGGALLVLAILGILTYRSYGVPFMGSFTVENIMTGDMGTMQVNRGRLRLNSLQVGQTGLDRKSYFQATGKNFVYFVSKKPVYADCSFKKSKKIKIPSSMDVRISASPDFDNGIIVRFESMLNGMF